MECETSHFEIHSLNIVYNDVPTTQENMKVRILTARINSEMTERVRESLNIVSKNVLIIRGHHFEHLFK